MERLTYVTSNSKKYIAVKEHFEEEGLELDYFIQDLFEPEINDIEKISRTKAEEAYSILGKPCFVADSGFYIDHYPGNPGYPGAFAKRSGVSSDIDSLLKVMENVSDRTCRFVDCLTFYDGKDFYTFYGVSEGSLADTPRGEHTEKAKSNLWRLFIPKNCSKTLAEMTDYERKTREDGRTSATELFAKWYKNEYNKGKIIKKEYS